jgi:hypothetical protein
MQGARRISHAGASARARVGLVLGRRDASRHASNPPVKYLPFQACTACRDTPYRTDTSPTDQVSNTSNTARYRCSTNHSRSPESTVTVTASKHTGRGANTKQKPPYANPTDDSTFFLLPLW